VFWEGTDHWDSLLTERAAISGRLVLTEPAQQAMLAFKKGAR
jgi:methylglutaconyl-CoA hydratase